VRLLADENVPWPLVSALREDGHDLVAVLEAMATRPDTDVLAAAVADRRVLLTFDRDFGEMIFARGFRPPPGVVFVREVPRSLAETIAAVRAVLAAPSPRIDGYFVAVDRKARYHPLPESSDNA